MTKHKYEQGTPSIFNNIIRVVVGFLKDQGFSSLKAVGPGFTSPSTVKWDDNHDGVIPHITGEHDGSVYVFEIETCQASDPKKKSDRWRLLSVFAQRNKGSLYLVVPESKEGYIKKVVNEMDVNPSFLKLSGLDV